MIGSSDRGEIVHRVLENGSHWGLPGDGRSGSSLSGNVSVFSISANGDKHNSQITEFIGFCPMKIYAPYIIA